jgi:hypothetical protein
MAEVDLDKFMEFVHTFAADLGATVAAGSVVIGDVAEWPAGQAASGT